MNIKLLRNCLLTSCLLLGAFTQPNEALASDLTFSNPPVINSSTNVGALADNTSTNYGNTYSYNTFFSNTQSTVDRYVPVTYPTSTSQGVSEHWIDTTYYQNSTTTTGFYDVANYSVNGNANNYAPSQWINIAGTVTANEATTFNYGLQASGNYLTTAIPGIGNVIPALPSLFVSLGSSPLTAVNAISSFSQSATNQYSVNSYTYSYNNLITLKAGETISFAAMVFAGADVSLANFTMNINSGNYGETTVSNTPSALYTTSQFAGSIITSVPEPSEWLLMLSGFGLIGFMARRKKILSSTVLMAA